jgi:hypothetical protein
MGADDVHLVRMGGADLGAPDFLTHARNSGLGIQRADPGVGLGHRVVIDAGGFEDAAQPRSANPDLRFLALGGVNRCGAQDPVRRLGPELIGQPLGIGAAIAF